MDLLASHPQLGPKIVALVSDELKKAETTIQVLESQLAEEVRLVAMPTQVYPDFKVLTETFREAQEILLEIQVIVRHAKAQMWQRKQNTLR